MPYKIELKKMGFRTALPKVRELYDIINNNRARLSPWFWWMGEKTTPNLRKTIVFVTLYILDTKRKKLMNILDNKKPYDEQFFAMMDNKIVGMIGLDNIDNTKKDSEFWYLVTKENEGRGIASTMINVLEKYSIDAKGLSSLYAKTADGNIRSENLLKRNNYEIEKVEYSVPTSKRNPKITNLTTWVKDLGR
ncbi:MAG: GNAT family N-acetyltransferase [Rickettsiales bacterium]|jgi:RimJ/RimL family protein N-acetyltransferase|nr:GNAT family N-acetyltransferase [Rickettsiales bacterium]